MRVASSRVKQSGGKLLPHSDVRGGVSRVHIQQQVQRLLEGLQMKEQ